MAGVEDDATLERMRAAAEDFMSDIPSFQEAGDFASLARGLGVHQRVAETACAVLDALTTMCSAKNRAEMAKQAVANIVSHQTCACAALRGVDGEGGGEEARERACGREGAGCIVACNTNEKVRGALLHAAQISHNLILTARRRLW